ISPADRPGRPDHATAGTHPGRGTRRGAAAARRRPDLRGGAVGRHRRERPGAAAGQARAYLGGPGRDGDRYGGPPRGDDVTTDVIVHADAPVLAEAVAARLLVNLIDAQAVRGEASLVLTGGRVAATVYRALAASPARHAVDWSRIDLWWGDERFLPAGHPDRNETQARAALAGLPLDQARVHPMPASDGPDGADPEAA